METNTLSDTSYDVHSGIDSGISLLAPKEMYGSVGDAVKQEEELYNTHDVYDDFDLDTEESYELKGKENVGSILNDVFLTNMFMEYKNILSRYENRLHRARKFSQSELAKIDNIRSFAFANRGKSIEIGSLKEKSDDLLMRHYRNRMNSYRKELREKRNRLTQEDIATKITLDYIINNLPKSDDLKQLLANAEEHTKSLISIVNKFTMSIGIKV